MSSDPSQPSQETEVPQESPESSPEVSPEQDPSPESLAAEEAAPEPEGDEAESEGEEQPAAPAPEKPQHKRVGGFQRRIDKLERQLEQALALAGQRGPQQPVTPETPKTENEIAAEQFNALVEQRVQASISQREAQAEQRRLHADLEKQKAAARTRYPDFDDAIASVSDIIVPEPILHTILTSDAKAEIMYSLAKNPAELARISALPPIVAAREIGRLEAKFASGAAPQTPKPAARPPAPPSKVGGTPPSTRSLDELPIAEYKRRMRSGGR